MAQNILKGDRLQEELKFQKHSKFISMVLVNFAV